MSQRIIITGATGMVGEGVLLTLLQQPDVEAVLSISRRPSGHAHPKLRELLLPDFFDLSKIESELAGYSACFFCAGVSSLGKKEPEYTRLTYDLTLHFAQALVRHSPEATFCYISGAGTGGRAMWARVKRRTETDLLALPFRAAYMLRPGFLKPEPGQRHVLPMYRWLKWLFPLMRRLGYGSTLRELGLAMLHAAQRGADKPVLEVKDIVRLTRSAG
ncbi:NAD-dependent epimerase/dehydratase family protein [Hymenobacter sp. UV11]|uniref:NAD-dependent epimerase/dehydratase family protein n=1 Tax=Hymenobacter sp. UV11 TaxID=1849735 RepID=UPI0010602A0D|nr:NAD-dependent epimerase/dehydratase family protein [Hymenobacter sp. UV11]TDN36684.1 epimerase [Hymenobacter sp. UV11]TFZ66186.1 NAD-dependent epimerase/dehydratase family protein [Hymenobacter sp. UV11]